MDLAWIILKQAILMLLLNVVGIIAYRTKVVDKNGGRQFSNFVLEIVTPVLVVNAYADVEYESRLVVNMLWTFLLAAVSYVVFIAAVYLLVRQKPGRETEIERFSAIYSNCGFMGIPLASAILGNEGVFYTTAFLSVFFCFAWTHGIMLLTGQHDRKALVKKLCSPTMIGIVIGFRFPEIGVLEKGMDRYTPFRTGKPALFLPEIRTFPDRSTILSCLLNCRNAKQGLPFAVRRYILERRDPTQFFQCFLVRRSRHLCLQFFRFGFLRQFEFVGNLQVFAPRRRFPVLRREITCICQFRIMPQEQTHPDPLCHAAH